MGKNYLYTCALFLVFFVVGGIAVLTIAGGMSLGNVEHSEVDQ